MVKFQIASDLHIEYKNDQLVEDIRTYIEPHADILILAGDIGNLYKYEQLLDFLSRLCLLFQYVLYIPGNHEYYNIRTEPEISLKELSEKLKSLETKISNLRILDRESICIDDVYIIGCTLWSKAKVEIPDYIVRIQGMNRKVYNEMYSRDLRFLLKTIEYCKRKQKKILVVTHHCPTYKVIKGRKEKDKFISLYASDLDSLLDGGQIHTWVCGHIHRNFDFTTVLGTRLVGNQFGKPKDAIPDYRKNMIIEV